MICAAALAALFLLPPALQAQEADAPKGAAEKPVATEPEGPYSTPINLLSGSKDDVKAYNEAIERLLQERDFGEFKKAFEWKIAAASKRLIEKGKLNVAGYKKAKLLQRAVDLCVLIERVGVDNIPLFLTPGPRDVTKTGAEGRKKFMQWLLTDKADPLHALMSATVSQEVQKEKTPYNLKKMFDIWESTPEADRSAYLKLMCACALVYPGFQYANMRTRCNEKDFLTVEQRFDYFREKDKAGKLLTDIKKLSVAEALLVVDVYLPRSEYDWVDANMRWNRTNWGDAYASIKYMMSRAQNNADPYTKYTLAEIKQLGGVCRDQAYYTVNGAKVKGIPAVMVTGDGDRGGHAWVAIMVGDHQWKGWGSYGYKTGTYINPCYYAAEKNPRVWHESLLLNSDKKSSEEKLAPAYDCMLLSRALVQAKAMPQARSAAKAATGLAPAVTTGWENRVQVMAADEDNPPSTEAWKKLLSELNANSNKNPELIKISGIITDDYMGKSGGAEAKRAAQKLKKVKDQRSDLLLENMKRQGDALAEKKDYKGLAALYKRGFRDNAERGDVFLELINQYSAYLEEGSVDKKAWNTLAKDAEGVFYREVMAKDTNDYFKVKREYDIMVKIAEAYNKAGNSKKADKISKEAEARLSASGGSSSSSR